MLETLRKGATSKIAAIIIFVPLIIAFALWGIAPEVTRGGARGALATVGKVEITPDQFQQAYQIELQNLSTQFGRRITPEQGRMFGLDQRVLSRLVGAAALDQQAQSLGLTTSERDLAEQIRSDSNFAGLDGRFSRDTFNNFLRSAGLSEAAYLALRRKEESREQVVSMLADGAPVPKAIIDTLHRHRAETRVIEFFTMDPDKVVKIADPDDAALKTYYEANKRTFMTQAFRKAGLLVMSKDKVKTKLDISEADIKAAYETTKDIYNTAETRALQQIAFPDKAAAEKAYAVLSKAANFVEEAGKLGTKATDLDLGTVTKAQMIDKTIGEAAFALKKGEVSKPIEGKFSTVIVRAVEVTPGTIKTFDDVKSLVKDKLADERAGREMQALFDKVEDERSAGRPLKDAAERLGLTFLALDAVDRNGNGADGKPIAGIPDVAKVMTAVFAATQGVETDAIELADGGSAWIDLQGITPEKERPFDEVKADAKSRWLDIEKARALTEAAAKLVERGTKGEDMAKLAAEAGGKVEATPAVMRTTSPQGLTNDAVRQAFALPQGAMSVSATADGKSRSIFRIKEITVAPEATKEQVDRIKSEVARGLQTDALNAYVTSLQARQGVNVNQQVLQQTLGLDRQVR